MKLVSVSNYKLIVVISGNNMKSDVYTYYSSLDLVNYLIENDINNISNEDIEVIMEDNNFSISKNENTEIYKSIQISKLSSINELSIDEYLSLKENDENAVVLLINPNMNIDIYNFIPIFIGWENVIDKYNFYYVNGLNVLGNDMELLDTDEELKEYLVGINDCNILIFSNGDYKKLSIDINVENSKNIFNCILDDCFDADIKIYDDELIYDDIRDVLNG